MCHHAEPHGFGLSKEPDVKYLPAVFVLVFGLALGVAAVVYGEADDSPGLQLIGGLLVLGAVGFGVRSVRHSRQ